jgi:hypothetical protein
MVVAFLVLFASSLYGQQESTQPPPAAETLESLRLQIEALKADYEKHINDLQKQIDALQGGASGPSSGSGTELKPTSAPSAAPSTSALPLPPPSAPAAPQAPAGVAPQGVPGGAVNGAKVFNPDMAVIGDFLGAAGRNTVDPQPALEMHESELSLQAIVDPYARADFFISFGENGVELEEGYLTFPAVPGGLLVRVGKMRAAFGRVNQLHNHVLPWTDRPLVTRNLVGGEDGIDDAGFSAARLIPIPKIFLEATGQVFRGDSSDVFHSSKRGDLSYVGHLRGYQDITDNTNIDLGTSFAQGHNFAGIVDGIDVGQFKTSLYGIDATYRWRPLQRSIYHSFVGRSELIWSRRQQFGGKQRSFGYYVAGDFQLARRWFIGGRDDWSNLANAADEKDTGQSAVLTYWPSEFSQIRGQYRRTVYSGGILANEFLFQFQFSIGAHGAHPF